MATQSLQTESARANVTEGELLYAAWRREKAEWDLASYAEDSLADGPPDEVQNEHCDRTSAALNAYMLHPAEDLRALATKLRVFRDEDLADGWTMAREIVVGLAEDAHRLAFSGDDRGPYGLR